MRCPHRRHSAAIGSVLLRWRRVIIFLTLRMDLRFRNRAPAYAIDCPVHRRGAEEVPGTGALRLPHARQPYDFVESRTRDGRKVRMLNVIDELSRRVPYDQNRSEAAVGVAVVENLSIRVSVLDTVSALREDGDPYPSASCPHAVVQQRTFIQVWQPGRPSRCHIFRGVRFPANSGAWPSL